MSLRYSAKSARTRRSNVQTHGSSTTRIRHSTSPTRSGKSAIYASISLCDGFVDVVDDIAYLLEVDPSAITIYPGGTNHAIWVVRFTVAGEDGYPLLRARLDELSGEDLERLYPRPDVIDVLGVDYTYDEIYKQFIPHYPFPFSLKLFRIFGLLPGPRYYWRYLLDQDAIISAQAAGTYVSMAGFYMKHMEPRMFEDLDNRLGRSALALTEHAA